MYLIGFPLLVIPFAIYNMIAFLTPGLAWTANIATIHLISGQDWTVTPEDVLLAFAIVTWSSRSGSGLMGSSANLRSLILKARENQTSYAG